MFVYGSLLNNNDTYRIKLRKIVIAVGFVCALPILISAIRFSTSSFRAHGVNSSTVTFNLCQYINAFNFIGCWAVCRYTKRATDSLMNFELILLELDQICIMFTSPGYPYQVIFIACAVAAILIGSTLRKLHIFLALVGFLIIAADDTFVKKGIIPSFHLPGNTEPTLMEGLFRHALSLAGGICILGMVIGVTDENVRHVMGAEASLEMAKTVSDNLVAFDTNRAQGMLQVAQGRSLADTSLVAVFDGLRTSLDSFFKYVPRAIVKALSKKGTLGVLGMDSMLVGITFTDIKSFTTWCTGVGKEAMVRFIIKYFEIQTNIVQAYRGVVDKFIGDCLMVMWGAPNQIQNPILRACCAALAMDRATKRAELRNLFSLGREALTIRTGIHYGECLAGNMGTLTRVNYTVVGDPVNTAARLEATNKDFGTRILVSEDAVSAEEAVMKDLVLRQITNVRVVGRLKPLRVFEVVGIKPEEKDSALAEPPRGAVESKAAPLPNGDAPPATDSVVPAASDSQVGGQRKTEEIHVINLADSKAVPKKDRVSNPLQPPPPAGGDIAVALLDRLTEGLTMRYRFHQWLGALERNRKGLGSKDIEDTDILRHARAMCHVASPEEAQWAKQFSDAVDCYVQGDFDDALPLLQAVYSKAAASGDKDVLRSMIEDCEGPRAGIVEGTHK